MSVVVNAGYLTDSNNERKVVMLANGNIIVVAQDGDTDTTYLYKSTDGGANFTQMCYVTDTLEAGAVCSDVNTVYLLFSVVDESSIEICSLTIDTTTVANADQSANKVIVDTQTFVGLPSVPAVANVGTTLRGVWHSLNGTYPDSFNIRYSTSVDGGENWAAPTQLTTDNTAGTYNTYPSIAVSGGKPTITFSWTDGSQYAIRCQYYTEAWQTSTVKDGTTYAHNDPRCMAVESTGHIVCFYDSKDAIDDAKYNIRCSESTDGGANWGAETKLTSGNTYDQTYPSAGIALNDDIYLYFIGRASGSYDQVRRMVRTSGSWGAITDLTAYTTDDASDVQAMAAQVGTILGYVWMNGEDVTVEFGKETLPAAPEGGHVMTCMSKYWG